MVSLKRPWPRSIRKRRAPRAYAGQRLRGLYALASGWSVWLGYKPGQPLPMTAIEFAVEWYPPTADTLMNTLVGLASEAGVIEDLRFGLQAGPGPSDCVDGRQGAFVEVGRDYAELRIWRRDRATRETIVVPGRSTRIEFTVRVEPGIPLAEHRIRSATGSLEQVIALLGALGHERDVVFV